MVKDNRKLVSLKGKGVTVIHTDTERFDFLGIGNRRYLFNPKTGTLVLGAEQPYNPLYMKGNHCEEFCEAEEVADEESFDEFARGWVGTERGYGNGVVALNGLIGPMTEEWFNQNFDTLLMFQKNGALPTTVVLRFGLTMRQHMADLIPTGYEVKNGGE